MVGDLSSFLSWGQGVSCLLILLHTAHGSLVMQFAYCFCVQIWKSFHPLQLLVFPEFSDSLQKLGSFTMALHLCSWASVDRKEVGASNVLFMPTWVMAATASVACTCEGTI